MIYYLILFLGDVTKGDFVNLAKYNTPQTCYTVARTMENYQKTSEHSPVRVACIVGKEK